MIVVRILIFVITYSLTVLSGWLGGAEPFTSDFGWLMFLGLFLGTFAASIPTDLLKGLNK